MVLATGLFCVSCGDKKNQSSNTQNNKIEASSNSNKNVDSEKKSKLNQSEPVDIKQINKAKELIASVSKAEIKTVDAQKKYKIFCGTCHGFSGNANINGAKDLTKSKVDLTTSVAQVYHGKGLMTPFKGIMNDAEIIAVCQFIETLRH